MKNKRTLFTVFTITIIHVFSVHAMFVTTARRVRSTRPVKSSTSTQQVRSRGYSTGTEKQGEDSGKSTDQPTRNWLYDFLYGTAHVPVSPEIKQQMKRPANQGFWEKLWHHKLTPEEWVKKIEECFYRDERVFGTSMTYHELFFDDNSFEKVKALIDENRELIDQPIKEVWFGYNDTFDTFVNAEGLTILDRVLSLILRGRDDDVNLFVPRESALKFIELARYLIQKGAVITPEYEERYKRLYNKILMVWYKRHMAYSDYHKDTIAIMDRIFAALDPLLEELMPGFKDMLRRAQKERADIAADVKGYEEYEQNQQSFLRYKERKWRERHNNWDPDIYPYEMGISWDKINDKEYRDWLKHGRRAWQQFENSRSGGFRTRFEDYSGASDIEETDAQTAFNNFLTVLGLQEGATEKEAMKEFRDLNKTMHPDVVEPQVRSGDLSQEKADLLVKRHKKIMSVYGDWVNARKREQREKGKNAERE